jgi:hypothetical protein
MEPEIRPLFKPKTLGDFMGRPGVQPTEREIYQFFLEDDEDTWRMIENAKRARLAAEAELLEQEIKANLTLEDSSSN